MLHQFCAVPETLGGHGKLALSPPWKTPAGLLVGKVQGDAGLWSLENQGDSVEPIKKNNNKTKPNSNKKTKPTTTPILWNVQKVQCDDSMGSLQMSSQAEVDPSQFTMACCPALTRAFPPSTTNCISSKS